MYCMIFAHDLVGSGPNDVWIPVANKSSIPSKDVFKRNIKNDIFCIGFFLPDGKFYIEEVRCSKTEAMTFVNYLNGGKSVYQRSEDMEWT